MRNSHLYFRMCFFRVSADDALLRPVVEYSRRWELRHHVTVQSCVVVFAEEALRNKAESVLQIVETNVSSHDAGDRF